MDKYEYKVRAEEIKSLIAQGEYVEAVKIADTIDWHRVKSVMMLCTISDLYKINRRFEESKELLLLAYDRHPGGRTIVYSLCELSIKMEEYVQAIEYYKEFVQIAPRDSGRYILQYKLYEAQDVSLEERIAVLEELKKRDYREKWAYELAYLYHRIGLSMKCVEECDELILWFGEGKYVIKAMELKMLHQPLTPEQEKRYNMQMQGISMYEQYEEEEESAEPEELHELEQDAILNAATTRVGGIELDDIQVKTPDMGQYNTINLQKELAASMKELLDDGTKVDESLEDERTDRITKSILAPMFQNTEEMTAAVQESAVRMVEPEPVAEEVFFEETGEMPVVEDAEKLEDIVDTEPLEDIEEAAYTEETEDIAAIEELEDIEESAESEETISQVIEPDRAAAVMQQMREEAERQQAAEKEISERAISEKETISEDETTLETESENMGSLGTATYQILPEMPEPLAEMLSQESDGQISLVVPEEERVEKQITGQMSIEDILAEWERMKKDNEEKRREDVRRHVKEQTGNLFAEFDESARSGILAQLEELDADAKEREAAKPPITPHENQPLLQETEEISELAAEEEAEPIQEVAEEEIFETEEISEENITEPEIEVVTESEETENREEQQEKQQEEPQQEEPQQEELQQEEREAVENVDERMKLRQLTDEERELFGSYIHTRKAKEQFIKSIDSISMAAYTGNVIVTGDDHEETMSLAKNLIREVQMTDSNFSGKVAKVSGAALNKKDVEATLSRMENGAVIIESAGKLTEETAAKLYKYLNSENKGIIVVLEGTRKEINRFLKNNEELKVYFTSRFDIEALDDDALAAYGKKYAEILEYSIDELGMLALHTRISEMQTSTHVVNVAEVQEIVDEAIRHANRKNLRHFFDILIGERYDDEDMIILRERDFI